MLNRIYIEISNICNIQCSFCPVVERDKQVLEPKNFEKIIREASVLTKEVCLHLMGEPLAHPSFKEIVDLCQNYQVPVQITTNGLLIKKYQDFILSKTTIRQINFSLQSYKDNFPHKSLDDYLFKILSFSKKAFELRPELYINYRLWNLGAESTENDEIFSYVEDYFKVSINRRVEVGNIKSKRIWNRVYLHFDTRFEWPSLDLPYQGTAGRCNALTGHIGIHANGTVVPCCLDKEAQIPLGNCLEQSLETILFEGRAKAMKEGFAKGILVEKLCQHCSFITRFNKKKSIGQLEKSNNQSSFPLKS